jgi:hypothetical protein
MKNGRKMLVWMAGSLAFCAGAGAVTTDGSGNPYQSIIDRNVFSLKPAPPPGDSAEANKPQAVKITLTGITTILGNKRVLMKTAPPPGKPGEAKTEQSYILTEGQREGEIEVIEIDEKAGSVKVKNAGAVQTLTFEKDGAKLPATAPPPAAAAPGGAIPGLPVAHPAPGAPPPAAAMPNFQLPTRTPRLPGTSAQTPGFSPGVSGASSTLGSATPGFLAGNSATPVVQTTASAQAAQAAAAGPQLSLEEQAIMIEVNRQHGGPGAALLPPTMLTPKTTEPTPTPSPVQQNQIQLPIPGRPVTPGPF